MFVKPLIRPTKEASKKLIELFVCISLPPNYFLVVLEEIVLESQSRPSYSPSPLVPVHPCTYHCLVLGSLCSSNRVVISEGDSALGKSCLLANTNSTASFNSSSVISLSNSFLAVGVREREGGTGGLVT